MVVPAAARRLDNRYALVSANSRSKRVTRLPACGAGKPSFTLSVQAYGWTTAERLSPEFAPPAWRLAYRKLHPLRKAARWTSAVRLSPEFAPPAWRLAYRKLHPLRKRARWTSAARLSPEFALSRGWDVGLVEGANPLSFTLNEWQGRLLSHWRTFGAGWPA